MLVLCPHCRTSVDLAPDDGLPTASCPSCGTPIELETLPLAAPGPDPAVMGAIGRFKLLGELGSGSFGVVWKARDPQLDRLVAVKIARNIQSGSARTDFVREARAAAQLQHPHIISVYEVGHDDGVVYIVSEFIDGPSLRDWLRTPRPDAATAARLCAQLAEALHHAHEAGLVHRDVKPSNVLMDRNGEPHIADFGLAKRESGEATITRDGQMLGTPAYMPPEQARGESHQADRRADVYSLGVILYEMLTGVRPFHGKGQALVHQILADPPAPLRRHNRHVPVDLQTICLKCLEKSPAELPGADPSRQVSASPGRHPRRANAASGDGCQDFLSCPRRTVRVQHFGTEIRTVGPGNCVKTQPHGIEKGFLLESSEYALGKIRRNVKYPALAARKRKQQPIICQRHHPRHGLNHG